MASSRKLFVSAFWLLAVLAFVSACGPASAPPLPQQPVNNGNQQDPNGYGYGYGGQQGGAGYGGYGYGGGYGNGYGYGYGYGANGYGGGTINIVGPRGGQVNVGWR